MCPFDVADIILVSDEVPDSFQEIQAVTAEGVFPDDPDDRTFSGLGFLRLTARNISQIVVDLVLQGTSVILPYTEIPFHIVGYDQYVFIVFDICEIDDVPVPNI
jgi:hypothetical protein